MTGASNRITGITIEGQLKQMPALRDTALGFLTDPARFTGKIVKTIPNRTIATLEVNTATYYLKRYQPQRGHSLKARFRAPAARRAWQCLLRLRKGLVPTVQPTGYMAAGHRASRRGSLRASLLVTEAWNGVSLDRFLSLNRDASRRQSLWATFAALYGRLLKIGLYHGDPSLDNFLVNSAGQVVVVDVDGIKAWPALPRRIMIRNLIRLHRGLMIRAREKPAVGLTGPECRSVIKTIVTRPELQRQDLTRNLDQIIRAADLG